MRPSAASAPTDRGSPGNGSRAGGSMTIRSVRAIIGAAGSMDGGGTRSASPILAGMGAPFAGQDRAGRPAGLFGEQEQRRARHVVGVGDVVNRHGVGDHFTPIL